MKPNPASDDQSIIKRKRFGKGCPIPDSPHGYAPGVGERIRHLRGLLGWTQDELGAAIGKAKPRISLWETGRAVPRPKQVRAIADLTPAPEEVYRWLVGGGVLLTRITPRHGRGPGEEHPGVDAGAEGVTPPGEDTAPAEAQVRTLLREAERTVSAQIGDPETLGKDFLRRLRIVMVDEFIEQARESGRPIPPFLYEIRYELDKDLFR